MEGKEKLNILILSWRGLEHPNAGGAEISTHEHAKGWVKAGHNVTLFTAYYKGAPGLEIIDGVTIIRLGHQVFGVQLEAFKWYLFGKHPKFDLTVDQFHGIPFFTPLYIREKKLAFIHEVAKEVWWLNSWQKPLNLIPAIIGTIFEPLMFHLLYKRIPFMTVSDSTKKDLISWGIAEKNITVIHNGFNKPRLRNLPSKEKKKTIIFLGALSKDKGIEDALLTFAQLQKIGKENFQFWVIGKSEPNYLKFLKKKAIALRLKKIKFWGYLSEEKKFEFLSKSHVLINPSIREGWGLTVIEAAAMGTPTVAYNVPGLRDSIVDGKTGILCSENSVEDLANRIYQLLTDEKKYNRIRQNAISWSKNFSWEKASHESLKLIKTIAG